MTGLSEVLGWSATAVFTSSFLFRSQRALRLAQIFGASLWLMYGLAIGALPVIVANALVFTTATVTTFLGGARQATASGPGGGPSS